SPASRSPGRRRRRLDARSNESEVEGRRLKVGNRSRRALALLFFVLAAVVSAQTSRISGELDANGLAKRIARERGRVVLVNFWATWCPPCRDEFPDLSRLQRKYASQGLRVLGVSTDLGSQMPAVEKLLADLN